MKSLKFGGRFKRDLRRALKRGNDPQALEDTIELLRRDAELPRAMRPHALKGEWRGYDECHIEPDWLLIYKNTPGELYLARTGTHSDLFKE